MACGRTRFDGTSLCVAGRSGRGDANRHARESRARSTSESARRSLEGAGGFALASRCIGERHARHALPACTSTPTDQHAHGGGAGKSPKGFRPAGRRSLKRQVRAPIKKRRGVGATITSHALHSCAPAPFTAELLPPQMLYVHLYFGPSRVCAALRAVFAAVFEASNTAANTAVLSVAQSCISNCIRGPLLQVQIQPPVRPHGVHLAAIPLPRRQNSRELTG